MKQGNLTDQGTLPLSGPKLDKNLEEVVDKKLAAALEEIRYINLAAILIFVFKFTFLVCENKV